MRRSLTALALAGLLLTACGDDSSGAGTPAPNSSESPEASSTSSPASVTPGTGEPGAQVTPEALQFSAPVVGGGELDMSTFAGQTVAFWFWAPT